jgi:hypothetical protein
MLIPTLIYFAVGVGVWLSILTVSPVDRRLEALFMLPIAMAAWPALVWIAWE